LEIWDAQRTCWTIENEVLVVWVLTWALSDITACFSSQGFWVQKVSKVNFGDYVGVETALPRETSPAKTSGRVDPIRRTQ
jgi:hypothetical protein